MANGNNQTTFDPTDFTQVEQFFAGRETPTEIRRTFELLRPLQDFTPLAAGTEASAGGTEAERQAFSQLQLFQSGEFTPLAQELGIDRFEDIAAFDTAEGAQARQRAQELLQQRIVEQSQPLIAQSQQQEQEQVARVQQELANFANRFDFSGLTPEQTQRELAVLQASDGPRLQQLQQQIQNLQQSPFADPEQVASLQRSVESLTGQFGQTAEQLAGTQFTPEGVVRTDAGFVTQAEQEAIEAQPTAAPPTPVVQIEQAEDGTFTVIDERTGETITGLATPGEANARAEALFGGTPTIAGRPDLPATAENLRALQAGELESGRSIQAKQNAQQQGVIISAGDRLLDPDEFGRLRSQFGATDANFDQFFTRIPNPALGRDDIFLKADAFQQADQFRAGLPGVETAAGEAALADAENIDLTGTSLFDGAFSSALEGGATTPDAFVTSLNALDQGLFGDATKSPRQIALEQQQAALRGEVVEAGRALEGRGEAIIAAEAEAGVPDMIKQLQELNLRIAQKKSSYQAGEAKILDQAIPQGLLIGQQAALKRQEAVDMGLLYMQASALQDNVKLAQDLAQRTVDLQFADEEQRIQNTKLFLDFVGQDLSKEEAKQAARIELLLAEREQAVAEQKAEKNQTAQLMVDLAGQGIDPTEFGINFNKSFNENLEIASPLIADAAGQLSLSEQLDIAKKQFELSELERAADPFSNLFGGPTELTPEERERQEKLSEDVDTANNILDLVNDLAGHSGLSSAVGLKGAGQLFGLRKEPIPGTPAADFKAQLDSLKSLLTLGNLDKLSGVLSDTDIKLLQQASTALSTNMSEAAFKAELEKITNTFTTKLEQVEGELTGGGSGFNQFETFDDFLTSFNTDLSTSLNGSNFQARLSQLPKTQTRTSNAFGGGIITGYGSKFWTAGLDYVLPGGKNANVSLKFPVKVVAANIGHNGGFGNQLKVVDPNGREIWISHLDKIANGVTPGSVIPAGVPMAKQGNTGNTYGKTGIHLDVTMPKVSNPSFKNKGDNPDFFSASEVAAYLGTGIV